MARAKKKTGFAWECGCGNIEYSEEIPEECEKCLEIGSFIKIPEDLLEEKLEENILASKRGDEEYDESYLEDEK